MSGDSAEVIEKLKEELARMVKEGLLSKEDYDKAMKDLA